VNDKDRSTLVFLLGAIERTPQIAADLLALAVLIHPKSEDFLDVCHTLQALLGDETALLNKTRELRSKYHG